MHETPLFVKTEGKFEDYLSSLSKSARYNFRRAERAFGGLSYEEKEYDEEEIHQWMRLWARQLVRGEGIQWAFPVQHVTALHEKGVLRVFGCPLSYHFVECYPNGYAECHPPMYDKKYPYLGHYMWFSLLKFAYGDKAIRILDIGGGDNGTWPELIRNQKSSPGGLYKWQYIPQVIKNNPDDQPSWVTFDHGGLKGIRKNS